MGPKRPKPVDQTRVLIVEDEPRLRRLLETGVGEMGYPVVVTGSGEDALQTMETTPADVVLLDLNLPGMDGLEMFERLRRRWSATQVVILTGFGDLSAAQEAIRLDVVDFLTKPTSLGELERALDRARLRCLIVRQIEAASDNAESPSSPPAATQGPGAPGSAPARTLRDLEREHILQALERNGGNRSATAEELGISVRTLYYRLKEYGEKDDGWEDPPGP